MPLFHSRLSVLHLPLDHLPNKLLRQRIGDVVEYAHFQSNAMQSDYHMSLLKNMSPSFAFVRSFNKLHSFGALPIGVDAGEMSNVGKGCQLEFGTDSLEEKILNEEVQLEVYSGSKMSHKESQRRRKIGIANKGKVPWNKGRKHSAETRERIKQRTIEALKDPKVRKRMSEYPRAHSDQSKARIQSSLRRLWGERLKWTRLREKFFLSWAESIAEAAKKGGTDQQELEWDSYNKLKEEIAIQQLQWAADRAKAKEMAKKRAAQEKAGKIDSLARKRKEQEQKAEARGEIKRRAYSKSKERGEELAVAQGLKLKARLTKIHKRKSTNGQVCGETPILPHSASEKLDLEFIKREKMRREVSLADQIRAAKDRRAELPARVALMTPSSYSSDQRLE